MGMGKTLNKLRGRDWVDDIICGYLWGLGIFISACTSLLPIGRLYPCSKTRRTSTNEFCIRRFSRETLRAALAITVNFWQKKKSRHVCTASGGGPRNLTSRRRVRRATRSHTRLAAGPRVVDIKTHLLVMSSSTYRSEYDWGTIRSASLISVVSRFGHCMSLLHDR